MPNRPLWVLRTPWVAILIPCVLLSAGPLSGQCPGGDPPEIVVPAEGVVQELLLEGGSPLLGRVVEAGDPVRFELLSGDVLEVERSRIRCLRAVRGGQRSGGEFWPEDPNVTRLFFGPTGRSVGSGQGYLSVFELVMPFVAVGLGDRFTMAGGVPLFFTEAGIEVLYVAPKLEVIRTETFRGAVGALGFFAAGEVGSAGVLYGVGTIGRSTDSAVTLGAGWGYSTDEGIGGTPALMAGFEHRVSKSIKILSENYMVVDEGAGLIALGPRFFGERLSADVGLAIPFGTEEGFFAFPLVNFVWNW